MSSEANHIPTFVLNNSFLERQTDIEAWFRQQWQQTPPPIYGSVDLRNSGFKLAPVDTNLFPAGFNNLNPSFMALYGQAAQETIIDVCPDAKRLLLIPENHTRNLFYLDSLFVLKTILKNAGFEVRVGFMDDALTAPKTVELPSGNTLTLEPLVRENDKVGVAGFFPCCIILNNDLSAGVPELLQNTSQVFMPSTQLGWSNRLKSEHFRFYEAVCDDFAKAFDIDPWLLSPYFNHCHDIDFMHKEGQDCLVRHAEEVLQRIRQKYKQYNVEHEPFLVVKADQGTYGMAVMMIKEPNDLHMLNRKQRTHMSTTKGGVAVTNAIIQEGVYSFETVGAGSVAEPVVYLLGRHPVGGFYRVHQHRGPDENLNSPGMDFQPLCFDNACSVPNLSHKDSPIFYVYGVIARLALLAAARELAVFERGDNE